MKGVIIAAPASGSGKTLITLGLLRALAAGGRRVASAKVGPDYIDPAFHAAASGRPCRNLDGWAMREATLAAQLQALAADAEIVVCEGVMGLFDGAAVAPGMDRRGASADIARALGWPVVLVVDARAQAASAAAVVRGFATHEPGVEIAGVIYNRVGGPAHVEILKAAQAATLPDIPVLGCAPRGAELVLPWRHLGLVQALEHPDLEGFIEGAAGIVADNVDIAALLALARDGTPPGPAGAGAAIKPLGQKIAVARDAAFAFAYDHMLDGWRAAGAEVAPFSPLAGEVPAADADAVYLPGGYPELHAGVLAAAPFVAALQSAAARDAAIYGECGGYMVLGRALTDAEGETHAMAGLLGVETSFEARKLHLGYRRAVLGDGGILGPAGARFRGHEFHYATIVAEDGAPLFDAADAAGRALGPAGLRAGRVAGSFVHLIDAD
ncbi:MAG: cobyrinate a,c-diamide synthase [Rhodospirillaceae bacterium]